MRRQFGSVMISGARGGWIAWFCLTCWATAVEYELSGSYEYFGRRQDATELARQREFVKERTSPGQPPRMTFQLKGAYEKRYGPLSALVMGEPRALGEAFNREFKVWVRGNAWCIHTRLPGSTPKTGWEHGSLDGREFFMSLLTTNGGAMGIVSYRSGTVPHSLSDDGVPMVWMMTASGRYFDTLTNQLIWPAHTKHILRNDEDRARDYRQPGSWVRRDGKPGLPMAIAFLDAKGVTNAFYRATGFRVVDGLSLPSGFIWERYGGLAPDGDDFVIRTDERIVARITNFVGHCSRKDLRPRVLPNMSVADYRVKQPTNQTAAVTTNPVVAVGTKGYVVRDGKWPTTAKAQDLLDGRKRRPKDWIWAAVLAAVVLGGAVGWLRWRARRVPPPQPPPPPPTDAPSP